MYNELKGLNYMINTISRVKFPLINKRWLIIYYLAVSRIRKSWVVYAIITILAVPILFSDVILVDLITVCLVLPNNVWIHFLYRIGGKNTKAVFNIAIGIDIIIINSVPMNIFFKLILKTLRENKSNFDNNIVIERWTK